MNPSNLFDKWKVKIPNYDEIFLSLFDVISKKFGGSEREVSDLGKHFSSNYELYIYAFFLGLYNNEKSPISSSTKKVNFSYAIQFWGNKTNRKDRNDFSSLQDNIFIACVAKTNIDFIALEKGEITEDHVAQELIHTLECYANGGLKLIKERIESTPNSFLSPTAFLDFLFLDENT